MQSISQRDDAALLTFGAGLLFMILASVLYAIDGTWVLIGINSLLGIVLFVAGGQKLAASERGQ